MAFLGLVLAEILGELADALDFLAQQNGGFEIQAFGGLLHLPLQGGDG